MRSVKLAAVVIITAWLQIYFMGGMRPFGVVPNLLLIVMICAGQTCSASETLAMALGGGLLVDLASGSDFGLRMAFYSVVALAVLVARQRGLNFENAALLLAGVTAGGLLYNLLVIVGILSQQGIIGWGVVGVRVGSELLLNAGLALVLRPLLVGWLRPGGSGLRLAGE